MEQPKPNDRIAIGQQEQTTLLQLTAMVLNLKSKLYELDKQRAAALLDLGVVEGRREGMMSGVVIAHGAKTGRFSDDMANFTVLE